MVIIITPGEWLPCPAELGGHGRSLFYLLLLRIVGNGLGGGGGGSPARSTMAHGIFGTNSGFRVK